MTGPAPERGGPAPLPPFALLGDAAAPVCVDGVCVVPPGGPSTGEAARPAASAGAPAGEATAS